MRIRSPRREWNISQLVMGKQSSLLFNTSQPATVGNTLLRPPPNYPGSELASLKCAQGASVASLAISNAMSEKEEDVCDAQTFGIQCRGYAPPKRAKENETAPVVRPLLPRHVARIAPAPMNMAYGRG